MYFCDIECKFLKRTVIYFKMCHCHDNLALLPLVAKEKKGFMLRSKKVEFRCSILDKRIIEKKASEAGLSVSEYCRKSALRQKISSRLDDEELRVYLELSEYRNHFIRISNLLKDKDSAFAKEVKNTATLIRTHLEKLQ